MRRLVLTVCLLLFSLSSVVAEGKEAYQGSSDVLSTEVRRDFETILDVWREGRYDDLFGRTREGKETRESFGRKLADATLRPACCWEKIQDVSITVKGDSNAVVHAKLGFDGETAGTVFKTKSFKLVKEGGVWKLSRSEILSLAGVSKARKKKTSHHY